jgi:hypothetical protein
MFAAGAAVLSLAASVASVQIGAAAVGGNWLDPNESLGPNQSLISRDGQYRLTMRAEGDLVVYAPGNRVLWSSGTGVANSEVLMQSDGNLVVYTPLPDRRAVWASATQGSLRLELENDGNFVLYTTADHAARWAAAAITNRDNIAAVRYYGYVAMRGKGWADSEWSCLDSLWGGENTSKWRWNYVENNSGAYGIPKALPGTKMATAGSDWRDNPATQIAWGLGDIRARYGSPCRAVGRP